MECLDALQAQCWQSDTASLSLQGASSSAEVCLPFPLTSRMFGVKNCAKDGVCITVRTMEEVDLNESGRNEFNSVPANGSTMPASKLSASLVKRAKTRTADNHWNNMGVPGNSLP